MCLCTLALAACGRAASEAKPAPQLGVADFQASAFLRRHPAKAMRSEGGARIYSFADAYSESERIEVALGPDPVRSITVRWVGEPDHPAQWSSVKKQFMADLLESTFWDVDYGQVSSYLMDLHQPYADGPGAPIGPARIRAGSSGSDLVVRLERQA